MMAPRSLLAKAAVLFRIAGLPRRTRRGLGSVPLLIGLGLTGVTGLGACQSQLIPNTDIEDSGPNRGIVEFCEKYRKAVENQDLNRLMSMAAPEYYEDGGNVDASDDLDRAGLEDYLVNKFSTAKTIRYEIRYRRIGKGRNDALYIDYTYSASYKLPSSHGDQWRRVVADNRMFLAPKGDSYLILSGM